MSGPIKAFRNRGVDVAVWETRNGGYSITWRKSYKDKVSGEYKESKTLFPDEAKLLVDLLNMAVHFCDELKNTPAAEAISDSEVPF